MKYSLIIKLVLTVSIFFSSNLLFAHEGHGHYEHSVLHYFYSIEHLVVIAVSIVAVIAFVRFIVKEKAQ
jgi:hypothetical protein